MSSVAKCKNTIKGQSRIDIRNLKHEVVKVEPYPIPGLFNYLKTELNVDNGTYAIV